MEQLQLKSLKTWFTKYVAGFYGPDEYVNANIKLKEDHTHRTCLEMLYLAAELGLNENENLIAETIALLHDIGRFEQFQKYRTYNDQRSVNHGTLALDVLSRYNLLEPLSQDEAEIITTAIEFHGALELPKNLNDQTLLFAKLIRDADKIDILYVVTEYYKEFTKNPAGFNLELEFPDTDEYSAEIIDDLLNCRRTDYAKLRTLNDMKLLQLGWVYDVNFTATLKRLKERRLLEKLAGFLPETDNIKKAKDYVLQYVDRRIANGAQP